MISMPDGNVGLPPKAEDGAGLIERFLYARDQAPVGKETQMNTRQGNGYQSRPGENYSSAIAKAVEWLGDRYLLAKPINSSSIREAPPVARKTAQRRRPSPWDM
jgi:hypothetical protein